MSEANNNSALSTQHSAPSHDGLMAGVNVTTFDNGLTLVTKESHAAPVVTFWIWYRVGSRNEVGGITGISHWVEHMLFKGTEKLHTGDVHRIVSQNGGTLNGFTWLDFTTYFETLPSDRYEYSLQIESDRMVNARVDPDDVASERSVIISEREGGENSPMSWLDEEVRAAAYKVHPYHHDTIGWKSDLRAINRDDLYNYYRTYYAPNNAFIVVVGDFDTATLQQQVNEYFGSIPRGPEPPLVRGIEPEQEGERRVIVERPGQAAYWMAAYHACAASDSDAAALTILESVLSGASAVGMGGGASFGRSARIYKALVDTQIAVSAGGGFSFNLDPGLFSFSAMARDGVSLTQIEQAMDAVIAEVVNNPVSEDELKRAIKQTKAQFVYSAESVTNGGYWLGIFGIVSSFEALDHYLSDLEAVTVADVQRVAQKYLRISNRTVGEFRPRPMTAEDRIRMAQAEAAAAGGHRHFSSNPDTDLTSHHDAHRGYAFYQQPGDDVPHQSGQSPAPSDPLAEPTPVTQNSNPKTQTSSKEQALARLNAENITRRVLPNGIVVIVYPKHDVPSVSVIANFRAGSIYEQKEQAGLASFVATMLRRGTKSHSFTEINELTDNLAFSVGAGSGRHMAEVGGKSLREDFSTLVGLIAEMLTSATFPEEEIEKVRGNLITGLKERENDTGSVAGRKFNELAYPASHPYHYSSAGYIETVSQISRDDMLAFYHDYYRPDTTTIVVVGDIEPGDVLSELQKALGGWNAANSTVERPQNTVPDVEPLRGAQKVVSEVAGKTQADILLGFPSIPRKHPDYIPLSLGNYILGRLGLFGRLGENVRDRQGLAYYCVSSLEGGFGQGAFAVRAGVNPVNVEKAVAGILEEMNNIITTRPVSDEELGNTKSYITGSLPLQLETGAGIGRLLLDIELYELGDDYVRRYIEQVSNLTIEDIQAALQRNLSTENYVLSIAGSFEQ